MPFCPKCGGSGITLDGSRCECSLTIQDVYTEVSCLEIPEQYRSINLVKELIPDIGKGSYRNFLDDLHTRLSSLDERGVNHIICAPPRHSKTIFAYATMRRLFKSGIDVVSLYDLYEMKNMLLTAQENDPLHTVPVLFVKFPPMLNAEVFQTAALLLDRRVRRGNGTIFLYNGTWDNLKRADKFENFTPYAGDGSFCTVAVHSWKGGAENEG